MQGLAYSRFKYSIIYPSKFDTKKQTGCERDKEKYGPKKIKNKYQHLDFSCKISKNEDNYFNLTIDSSKR